MRFIHIILYISIEQTTSIFSIFIIFVFWNIFVHIRNFKSWIGCIFVHCVSTIYNLHIICVYVCCLCVLLMSICSHSYKGITKDNILIIKRCNRIVHSFVMESFESNNLVFNCKSHCCYQCCPKIYKQMRAIVKITFWFDIYRTQTELHIELTKEIKLTKEKPSKS